LKRANATLVDEYSADGRGCDPDHKTARTFRCVAA
jgi:hypothetical protein